MKTKKKLTHGSLVECLSQAFLDVPDTRQKAKTDYTIHDVLMSGFACMFFQDPSLLQFQRELEKIERRNNLQSLFDLTQIPSDTQIKEITDTIDSDLFRPVYKDFFSRLQRGKHLQKYQLFPGLYLCSVDGTQYYHSKTIHCDHCLTMTHRNGSVSYSHKVLQAAVMHPDKKQVIPLMPEEIRNTDGTKKQDCENKAFKRLIPQIRKDHPRLGLIIGGDSLFANKPCIDKVLEYGMHFIFTAKSGDHPHMMEWIEHFDDMDTLKIEDEKGRIHEYGWMNEVPVNSEDEDCSVNFFRYRIASKNPDGTKKIHYRSAWITDLTVTSKNVETLVKGGRCRWKIENECFNTLKNQGYHISHNYGHGKKHLCFNFFMMTLTAFFFHQIFELVDREFKICRKMHGSRKNLWQNLRVTANTLIFESWIHLIDFMINREKYDVVAFRRT